MRKLFYLGFCLVLMTGVGCAITNYELIVDNDQVKQGSSGTVNTQGKAHVIESSQIATLWPDGSDETIFFVDQKASGDRTLTTYNNFSTAAGPTFHDDLYCNPDHQGCAITTADDPEVGDVDIFDYSFNPNCSGARSLSLLLGTTRYYGECGRGKLDLASRIALGNMGRIGTAIGSEGLFYDLNRSNLTISLDNNAGFVSNLPVTADFSAFLTVGGQRKMVLDLTNPLLASMGRSYADFLANNATGMTTVTVTYNGISASSQIAGNVGLSNPSRVLSNVNTHF
jgi:hypothetical protein